VTAPTTREWLRTAADRVSIGSRRLLARSIGRAVKAVIERISRLRWWVQLGLAYVSLLRGPAMLAQVGDRVHERVESGAWSGFLTVSAIVWIAAAYRAGRGDARPPQPLDAEPKSEPGQGDSAEEPELDVEQAPAGPRLPALPDLRRSLLRIGTPHAHITALADDLSTTPERVREALAKWDVPVEPVRMKGRPSSSTGVKGGPAVHPALAPRAEDVAVVAAGGAANNDNNNAFETVPDGENPHRTHVLWKDTV
jgi:hypothetical protein